MKELKTSIIIDNLNQALKFHKNNYKPTYNNFLSKYFGKCLCKIGFTTTLENQCLKPI